MEMSEAFCNVGWELYKQINTVNYDKDVSQQRLPKVIFSSGWTTSDTH